MTTLTPPRSPASTAAAPPARRRADRTPYLLIAPSLVVLLGVLAYPLVKVVILSTQKWGVAQIFSASGAPSFVGLHNYTTLLGDCGVLDGPAAHGGAHRRDGGAVHGHRVRRRAADAAGAGVVPARHDLRPGDGVVGAELHLHRDLPVADGVQLGRRQLDARHPAAQLVHQRHRGTRGGDRGGGVGRRAAHRDHPVRGADADPAGAGGGRADGRRGSLGRLPPHHACPCCARCSRC